MDDWKTIAPTNIPTTPSAGFAPAAGQSPYQVNLADSLQAAGPAFRTGALIFIFGLALGIALPFATRLSGPLGQNLAQTAAGLLRIIPLVLVAGLAISLATVIKGFFKVAQAHYQRTLALWLEVFRRAGFTWEEEPRPPDPQNSQWLAGPTRTVIRQGTARLIFDRLPQQSQSSNTSGWQLRLALESSQRRTLAVGKLPPGAAPWMDKAGNLLSRLTHLTFEALEGGMMAVGDNPLVELMKSAPWQQRVDFWSRQEMQVGWGVNPLWTKVRAAAAPDHNQQWISFMMHSEIPPQDPAVLKAAVETVLQLKDDVERELGGTTTLPAQPSLSSGSHGHVASLEPPTSPFQDLDP